MIFFFFDGLFEKGVLKCSHWREGAVKGFSVFVTHITDCPFYFCMKKKIPNNPDINYISNLLFTDKTILSVS